VLILVSYDIPDDRRRTKLAHALKDFGERVQYSVFEMLLTEEQAGRLKVRIEGLVDTAEDSVRIYRFCADCGAKLEIVGLGVVTEDPKVYIV
jgi:CRISPR-associated protein Cas2